MPVAVSYPGVYLEEIPSGVRTITGVATSIAAFVDYFPQGPIGSSNAVEIFSFGDFERQFGGLNAQSEASYAIHQFFLNGGSQAHVRARHAGLGRRRRRDRRARHRCSMPPARLLAMRLRTRLRTCRACAIACAAMRARLPARACRACCHLLRTAGSAGGWGNAVRHDVDYDLHVTTGDPPKTFNLTVTRYAAANSTQVLATEKYVNTSSSTAPNPTTRWRRSTRIRNSLPPLAAPTSPANRPAASGTISAALAATYPNTTPIKANDTLAVTLANGGGTVASGTVKFATAPTDYGTVAGADPVAAAQDHERREPRDAQRHGHRGRQHDDGALHGAPRPIWATQARPHLRGRDGHRAVRLPQIHGGHAASRAHEWR